MPNPQETLEKKILISVESTLKGVQDTLKSLEKMRGLSGHASKATKTLESAQKDLSKSLQLIQKNTEQYNKSLTTTSKLQKVAFETMRSLGSITRIALGGATAAIGAYLLETNRIGKSMIALQTSSITGVGAIDRLSAAYANLTKSGSVAVLSLQDVAESIAKFQSQNIANMSLDTNKKFKEGFIELQSMMTRVLGKGEGEALFAEFYKSFGSEFEYFRETMSGDIRELSQNIQSALVKGDKASANDFKKQLETRIRAMRIYADDAGMVANSVANIIQNVGTIENPLVAGKIKLDEFLSALGTVAEQFTLSIVEVFGKDFARVVDSLISPLKDVENVTQQITAYTKDLHSKFEAWGGTDKVIKVIQDIIAKTLEVMKWLGSSTVELISWFNDLGTKTKWLGAIILGISFNPGLSLAVFSLISGFKDLAFWAYRASVATKAVGVAKTAATFLGGAGAIAGAATVAAPIAIGGYMAYNASEETAASLSGALSASSRVNKMDAYSNNLTKSASTTKEQLIAKRFKTERLISGIEPAGTESSMFGSRLTGEYTDSQKKMLARLQAERSKIISEIKAIDNQGSANLDNISPALEEVTKETTKLKEKVQSLPNDPFIAFKASLAELKTLSDKVLPGLSTNLANISSIIMEIGPQSTLLGDSLGNLAKEQSLITLDRSFETLKKSASVISEVQSMMRNTTDQKDLDRLVLQQAEAMKAAAEAAANINKTMKAGISGLDKNISQVESLLSLRKADLEISQNLYGTPALAVESLQEIISLTQSQIGLYNKEIEFYDATIDRLRGQGVAESELAGLQQERLDILTKSRNLTAQMVAQTKELRDGYLDAVKAQALGAGRFSKIILTQDMNVMRGLQQGAFKKNFLLGQYGADASKSKAQPYKFSAQGIGFLEDMGGVPMSKEDIAKTIYDRIDNIAEPLAAAAARANADSWMHVISGADKNTLQLSSVFSSNTDRVVASLDPISKYANTLMSAGAPMAAVKGTQAGETVTGSAVSSTMSSTKNISSNVRGNWQAKGRAISQLLQEAGKHIEAMGDEIDNMSSEQNNLTPYASNRLFSVQPM